MRFIDSPKNVGIEYYNKIRFQLISYYSKYPYVVSLYEYGSVSTPGISDLDIVLVLKDDICNPMSLYINNVSKQALEILDGGTLMMMPESVFKNIKFLDNLNFNLLYGKKINQKKLDNEQKKFVSLLSLIDWIPERMLRLVKIVNSQEVSITKTLGFLYSYTFSLKNFNNILCESKGVVKFIEKVENLRKDWEKINNPQEILMNLSKQGVILGYTILKDYEKHLKLNNLYYLTDFKSKKIELELFKNQKIVFTNDSELLNADKSISASDGINNVVYISSYFYPHFAAYAGMKGILSNNMKPKIQPFVDIELLKFNDSYLESLNHKMQICEENAKFLTKNKIRSGLIRFGFHFTNNHDLSYQKNYRNILNWFLSPKSNVLKESWLVKQVADSLCLFYRSLSKTRASKKENKFKVSGLYESDYKEGYFKPLMDLKKFLIKDFEAYFKFFLIHGSLATKDYVKGWSDLDTFVVLNCDVFYDSSLLMTLRSKLIEAYKYILELDPLQHHGFIVFTDFDLSHYLDEFIPVEVLMNAKSIFGDVNLDINQVNSKSSLLENFKQKLMLLKQANESGELKHHAYYGKYLQGGFKNANDSMYQMKYFLEYVMNLPVLYLQVKGQPCYKRDSFEQVKKEFKPEWRIIRKASKIRKRWGEMEEHPFKGNTIPKWLQDELGKEYFSEAVLIADKMLRKLGQL